ncbi:MAG: hypothetical protein ACREHD_03565 [Pirellulales bacterium]
MAAGLPELLERWSKHPVPVGRFERLRALGTLQAKIGAAYLFHWLRYNRAHPTTPSIARCGFRWRSLLFAGKVRHARAR